MSKTVEKRVSLTQGQLNKLGNLKIKSGDTINSIVGKAIDEYCFTPDDAEVSKHVRVVLSVLNSLEIESHLKAKVIKSLISFCMRNMSFVEKVTFCSISCAPTESSTLK